MKSYGPDRIHNIGLFGHGGSGKTSLLEAMCYVAGATTRLGRVEDGNTVSDYDPDEQKRRMSVNLAIAPIEWKENKINVIDTPGFADFAGEVAAAMRVIDGAVIVLDASGGVEVGTELVWEAARKHGVPCIIFINKMDRENANFERTLEEAQQRLDKAVTPMQIPIGSQKDFRGIISLRKQRAWIHSNKHDGKFEEADVPADMVDPVQTLREALIDKIAVTNDDLIEKYLEGGADALTAEELRVGLRAGIANQSIIPVFVGSATQVAGIAQLLDGILDSVPSAARKPVNATDLRTGEPITLRAANNEPLAALVFKTLADPYVGRITYIRVFSGELHSNSSVINSRTGKEERLGQISFPKGKEQISTAIVSAGDICAVTKLTDTTTGDTLYSMDKPLQVPGIEFPAPAFTALIRPHSKADLDKLGTVLQRIVEEDPTLRIGRDSTTGETLLSGLGESHMQMVAERMKRFGVNIDIHLPRIPYRETIRSRAEANYRHKKQTGGAGQFADVTLRVEPLAHDPTREDPLEFVWEIVGGVISRGFAPAIEKGVREAMAEGLLSGNPVVDVRVAVFDGKEHPVDSKEIAFKIAGKEAFKLAAQKANPVIMEPIYLLKITVPEEFTGDIMSDLSSVRRGRVLGMEPGANGRTVITAHVPLAECQRYATDLRSMTQGKGTFTMEFDHYEDVPTHLVDKVIEQAKQVAEAH